MVDLSQVLWCESVYASCQPVDLANTATLTTPHVHLHPSTTPRFLLPTPIYLTSPSSRPPSTSLHPPPDPHLPHFTLLPTPIYLTSPSLLPQSPFLCMAPMVPLHQHNLQLLQRCRRWTLACCTPLTVMIWESAMRIGLSCSP